MQIPPGDDPSAADVLLWRSPDSVPPRPRRVLGALREAADAAPAAALSGIRQQRRAVTRGRKGHYTGVVKRCRAAGSGLHAPGVRGPAQRPAANASMPAKTSSAALSANVAR